MHNFKSYKDVTTVLWSIEEEFNLIEYKIDNVYIWQVVRMEIATLLFSELLDLGGFHRSTSPQYKLKNSFRMLINSFISSPWDSSKKDILIFPHDRVVKVDNKYIDIYTQYFIDNLQKQNKNFMVLEKPYLQKHYTKKNKYIKYLDDSILLNGIKLKIKNKKLNFSFFEELKSVFRQKFGIEIDFQTIFSDNYNRYRNYYNYYYSLLSRLSPSEIYIVVSYAYPWLVSAAKDLNIKVIEFQHGTFSKYHLGYSYPFDKTNLKYLPDRFFVWNEYWKNLISLPILEICIYPFIFQNKQLEKYKNIQKVKNQIVVLSQGFIGNMLAKVILDNFKFFQNKIIKYKLHPGEIDQYVEYEFLQELSKYNNVEIIIEGSLYKLLAESEYQMGVSSTALYEGLELGLKTILADLPSVEYMDALIENNLIYKIFKERSID